MMYWFDWFWGYGWFWIIWWIIMLLFWWVIIYFFVQVINQNNLPRRDSRDALDILKERYAKWEITKAELEEMRKVIMK
ncbi:MAG: hypothetical protein ACD_2C00083G0002 [uncultured bacterium (gcode 4)]|uniref:SHOCT domain-containing protein n=1 Tax=uncultured bacterium (gcode 4) TaxID=1234023 RepID=K2GHE9_9BACT|nr:MAG: hypothetical protein ACD_2C00083G0002 [uncultured bacterium (gcode 4)]